MAVHVCISICIFLLIELQSCHGQEECPVNEVPVDCVDACSNTCEPTGHLCSLVCSPGCDCEPGYARDRFGVCIPRRYCHEDSVSPPDGDDRRICPDSARCADICRRRGFVGGACRGLAGRTCYCLNRSYPEFTEEPPLSLDDDVEGDEDSEIESRRKRRCKKICIGKKKRRRNHKCKCKGIGAG